MFAPIYYPNGSQAAEGTGEQVNLVHFKNTAPTFLKLQCAVQYSELILYKF